MRAFCPRCGYDLTLDAPILLNDFSMMGPNHPLLWCGEPVYLTPTESMMCWSLMKSYPSPVRHDTLLDRMDSEGTSQMLHVVACRIRKKVRALGAPSPLTSAAFGMSRAYIWVLD